MFKPPSAQTYSDDSSEYALVSKEPPAIQRRMAQNRGWKFCIASHSSGRYMAEQCAMGDHANYSGAAVYRRRDDKIMRRSRTSFGPGDLYSPIWHLLGLAGSGMSDWTPQYHYWCRPEKLDDSGENIRG